MVEVRPADASRLADVGAVLAPKGGPACWCLYYRLSSSDYRAADHADRPAMMRARLEHAPAPGLVAYIDGEPVGWCGLGPRSEMERLARSRTIPAVDERPVWSIVCFLVRSGYRRRGVARALLDGAIAYAREQGAPALEAYPVDPAGGRIDTSFAYVGTTSMFEAAGFRRVVETGARSAGLPRWLMRLDLAPG